MKQRWCAGANGLGRGRRAVHLCGIAACAVVICLSMTATASPVAVSGPSAPAEVQSTGTLHGMVRLGPRLAGRRVRFSLYPDPSPAAPPVAASSRTQPASSPAQSLADEMANVVVYFESSPRFSAVADPHTGAPRMEQRQETFFPHVLTVVAGTTVEFPNVDPIYHNVFSLSKAASFDLGRYPRGSSRTVQLDKPGIVKVFCHIHSDMSAVIMVLDHPFFAVPDPNGEFSITGIPPGRYQVTGWHERARVVRREVTIEGGHQTEVSLEIPIEEITDGR